MRSKTRNVMNLHEKLILSEIKMNDPCLCGISTFIPPGEIDRHMIIDPEAYAWQTRNEITFSSRHAWFPF